MTPRAELLKNDLVTAINRFYVEEGRRYPRKKIWRHEVDAEIKEALDWMLESVCGDDRPEYAPDWAD